MNVSPRIFTGWLIWLLCAAPALSSALGAGQDPSIRLDRTGKNVEVIGLDPADLANLARASLDASQWRALFAVYVQKDVQGGGTNRPAVLGSYRVDEKTVRFEPRFPLAP